MQIKRVKFRGDNYVSFALTLNYLKANGCKLFFSAIYCQSLKIHFEETVLLYYCLKSF